MKVVKVSADSPVSMQELWSLENNSERTKVLFSNDVAWDGGNEYDFMLLFHSGEFTIDIKDASGERAHIQVADDSYRKGSFGFYNYSQPALAYRGFSAKRLLMATE
jgi:hypothetical protein